MLKGITSNSKLAPSDWAYDSVSGVSGGAINAVLLSSFEKGQEAAAADRMEKFWTDATQNTLYKNWLGGIARGLFFEGGLYNSAPLEDFLKKEFSGVDVHRKALGKRCPASHVHSRLRARSGPSKPSWA